jgi:EAL domain-containing protein (putative c-di-GMP-specific phosphodiesterase class I)
MMAHALGLEVIANGVATAGLREFLAAQGCDEMEGPLLARAPRRGLRRAPRQAPSVRCLIPARQTAVGQKGKIRLAKHCKTRFVG